jgi:hypothetical protein
MIIRLHDVIQLVLARFRAILMKTMPQPNVAGMCELTKDVAHADFNAEYTQSSSPLLDKYMPRDLCRDVKWDKIKMTDS